MVEKKTQPTKNLYKSVRIIVLQITTHSVHISDLVKAGWLYLHKVDVQS
jgi:hypothetical protein